MYIYIYNLSGKLSFTLQLTHKDYSYKTIHHCLYPGTRPYN